MVTMVMNRVICEVCAKAEECVKHIPQYVFSNKYVILDTFPIKCELKLKKSYIYNTMIQKQLHLYIKNSSMWKVSSLMITMITAVNRCVLCQVPP